MREELLQLRGVGNEALDGAADHGVLAHQDNGLASQGGTDLVHLLRGDTIHRLELFCRFYQRYVLVNADNEDGLVLVEQALELVEVDGC